MVTGVADEHRALADGCGPAIMQLVPVLEGSSADGDGHVAALSWLQGDLLEAAQFLDWHIDHAVLVADVELDDFGAGSLAGVLDSDCRGDSAVGVDLALVETQIA